MRVVVVAVGRHGFHLLPPPRNNDRRHTDDRELETMKRAMFGVAELKLMFWRYVCGIFMNLDVVAPPPSLLPPLSVV